MWTHCRWINIYSQFPCTDILQKLQPQIGQISKLMTPAGQRLVVGFLNFMCFKLSLMFIRKNGCLFVCMLKAYLSVCLPELLVCLPACLTACLTVYLSAFLPACINACLAAWMLFISVSLSHLNLSILTFIKSHPSVSQPISIFTTIDLPASLSCGLWICLSVRLLPASLPFGQSVCSSVCLSGTLSICWSVCRSIGLQPVCQPALRSVDVSVCFSIDLSLLFNHVTL